MNLPTLRTGLALPHPEPISGGKYSAVELMPGDRVVCMLDQRGLPREEHYELLTTAEQVEGAIRSLAVRGAPAIGISAAYAMVLAAVAHAADGAEAFVEALRTAGARLKSARPTAVNLAWAVAKQESIAAAVAALPAEQRIAALADAARAIHAADVAACKRLGDLGAGILPAGAVLVHCNAGALATGGYGSALGIVRAARASHKLTRVFACETRPVLQGSRLTAWELMRDRVPTTVVTDNMAGYLMQRGEVAAVVVGADRIARNGDVANKIGTYGLACLARAHDLPLIVAAPFSTVDMATPTGAEIPIENRGSDEVTHVTVGAESVQTAPDGATAINPAFDVTPARLVHAIVTERGIASPVDEASLERLSRLG